MQYGNYAIASCLIIFGLFTVGQQELIPISEAGILRYKPQAVQLPIPTLLTALLVAITVGYIWATTQWPWMLVGTLVMLGINALPRTVFSTLVCSSGDLLFIVGLFTTALIVHS